MLLAPAVTGHLWEVLLVTGPTSRKNWSLGRHRGLRTIGANTRARDRSVYPLFQFLGFLIRVHFFHFIAIFVIGRPGHGGGQRWLASSGTPPKWEKPATIAEIHCPKEGDLYSTAWPVFSSGVAATAATTPPDGAPPRPRDWNHFFSFTTSTKTGTSSTTTTNNIVICQRNVEDSLIRVWVAFAWNWSREDLGNTQKIKNERGDRGRSFSRARSGEVLRGIGEMFVSFLPDTLARAPKEMLRSVSGVIRRLRFHLQEVAVSPYGLRFHLRGSRFHHAGCASTSASG